MAPLQKRAWLSLGIGLLFTIAIIVVFVIKGGIATFTEDQGYRIIVNVLWIGALLASLLMSSFTFRKTGQIDERDKLIVDRAQRIQLLAVMFSLAAWTVFLPEVYHSQRQIPIAFIYLIFMSVLIIMARQTRIHRGMNHIKFVIAMA